MAPRFGTDGVRGVANTELTAEHVLRLGRAAAKVLASPSVLIGQDTRRSSPMIVAALAAGFASEGVDVVSAGVLPTPALAWIAAQQGVAAAMVTASHNPFPDNGVKLFAAGGRKLPDDVEGRVDQELATLGAPSRAGIEVGSISMDHTLAARYVGHFVERYTDTLAGLRVVADCANGAISGVAPVVLRALGADVVAINDQPDGCNINDHCGATHPSAAAEGVLAHGADAGLAFDGDGDRVMVIDRAGNVIDGDRLMAVLAPAMKAAGRLRGDAVVVTVMTNLGFRRAMGTSGIRVVETAVGDRYVLEALEREQLSLGGEQSGHIILPELSTTGDGLLAGVELLRTVRESGHELADVAAEAMVSYPQVLVNVRMARPRQDVAALVADEIAAVEGSFGGDGRVLIRPSGTEPVVRVMVEAPSAAQARRTADHLAAVIHERLAN
jgi:phosphoglucosamine mutase